MRKIKCFVCAALVLCTVQWCFAIKKDFIKIVPNPAKERIDVTINGDLFTSLMYTDSLKRPTLYPIYTSEQNMLTRGWPIMPKHMDRTDYRSQVGMFFSYSNVNGVDYWNNTMGVDTTKRAYGTVKFQKIVNITNGAGKASLTILSKWYNPGAKAIIEETSVFVFKVEGGVRMIDRSITLKALTGVTFKDTKAGLYAIRLATELGQPKTSLESAVLMDKAMTMPSDSLPLTGRYFNNDGLQGDAVFGKRSKWLKLTGRVNNEQITVVMMDHPQNVNYPGFAFTRSFGLMGINPLGSEFFTNGTEKLDYTLAKGKQVTFKYRFVQGGRYIANDVLDKLYSDFAGDTL